MHLWVCVHTQEEQGHDAAARCWRQCGCGDIHGNVGVTQTVHIPAVAAAAAAACGLSVSLPRPNCIRPAAQCDKMPPPMAWRRPRTACERRGARAQASTGRAARAAGVPFTVHDPA
eukprot:gene11102-biopygen22859